MKPKVADEYSRQLTGVDLIVRLGVGLSMWLLGGGVIVWLGSVVF